MIFAQSGRIATQFRWSRRELDSTSKRVSFFSCWYPRTKILQSPRLVWWEWWRNYRLHKINEDDASSVFNTANYNNISMTRAELGTCWIPGWARKRKKFSLLQITMAWGCSMMHSSSGTTLMTSWTGGPNLSCVLNKLSIIIPPT